MIILIYITKLILILEKSLRIRKKEKKIELTSRNFPFFKNLPDLKSINSRQS